MGKKSTYLVWLLVAVFALNMSETVMATEEVVARTQEQLDRELMEAVGKNSEGGVERLIRAGAKVNFVDRSGCTPLHCAIGHNGIGIAEMLLEKGGRLNAADREGNTPLHWAVSFACVGGMTQGEWLAKNQNNAADREEEIVIFTFDVLGVRLFRKCVGYIPEMVTFLLAHDADTSIKNKSGCTPIEVAQTEQIRKLLRDAIANRIAITALASNTLLSIQAVTEADGEMADFFVLRDIEKLLAIAMFRAHGITPNEE